MKTNAFFGVTEVFEGEEAELTETIENAKILPLPMVKLKLMLSRELKFKDTDNTTVSDFFHRTDIYNIMPYQRIRRTMRFVCAKRGYYTFRGVDVIGTNLFLTREYVESVDSSSFLYVFPKPYRPDLLEPIFNRINGETLTKRNLAEDPFELRGIREYQPYDGMKNINWKASAKTGDLMVNVHDYTAHRTIKVFTSFDKPKVSTEDDLLELLISMTAATVLNYAKGGIPVALYTNGKDILTDKTVVVGEGSGENYIRGINRSLARIDLTKKNADFFGEFHSLFEDESDDSFSIFYSVNDKEEFQEALLEMIKRKKDFCWIYPTYKNEMPDVDERIKEHCILVSAREALYEISLY